MGSHKISERYTIALYELAVEKKVQDNVLNDMIVLESIISETKEFGNLLKSPVISTNNKIRIISKIFENKIDKLTFEFLILMTRKQREKFLPDIATLYQEHYYLKKGIKKAYLQSAVELDDNTKQKLLESLKHITPLKIELQETINKNLIGGFIINIDDYQIDQSLSFKLSKLKKELSKNLFIKDF